MRLCVKMKIFAGKLPENRLLSTATLLVCQLGSPPVLLHGRDCSYLSSESSIKLTLRAQGFPAACQTGGLLQITTKSTLTRGLGTQVNFTSYTVHTCTLKTNHGKLSPNCTQVDFTSRTLEIAAVVPFANRVFYFTYSTQVAMNLHYLIVVLSRVVSVFIVGQNCFLGWVS